MTTTSEAIQIPASGGAMSTLLANCRAELIARCAAKAARRPGARATPEQLANGIPVFMDQLASALDADAAAERGASLAISGSSEGEAGNSQIGNSAASHGAELLSLGYDVESVVHAYGDLCQSLTDLAVDRMASFSVEDFRTLNRCLDNAVADAVAEFAALRDAGIATRHAAAESRRLGWLAHELRNALNTSNLAYKALGSGSLPVAGATGTVLGRGLTAMGELLNRALGEARAAAPVTAAGPTFPLAELVSEVAQAAVLEASSRGCELRVAALDPTLGIAGDRDLLLAALGNVLGNALKFTHVGTAVTVSAHADEAQVAIEVSDHCGGLPPGAAQKMFRPFSQIGTDRSGLGLGLAIARESVEADGGEINVRNVPGVGCVFSIRLPRRYL